VEIDQTHDYQIWELSQAGWRQFASAASIPEAYTIAYYHAALYKVRAEVCRLCSPKHAHLTSHAGRRILPAKFKAVV